MTAQEYLDQLQAISDLDPTNTSHTHRKIRNMIALLEAELA